MDYKNNIHETQTEVNRINTLKDDYKITGYVIQLINKVICYFIQYFNNNNSRIRNIKYC